MAKVHETWLVLPHDPPVELAENLWSVEGGLQGMPLRRRMTIARLSSGGLVIHNPVALEESEMKKIEGWGEPRFIVVPNGWHRLDSPNFKKRYPAVKVVCPAGARKKVEQALPVDLTYSEMPADDAVSFEHLAGVRDAEGVMKVKSSDGLTLVFNDLLFNMAHLTGFDGFVFKLMGSTGGPKITRVGRLLMVKQRPALRAHLERLAEQGPRRLIPGHGELISDDAPAVLRRVAAKL